MLLDMFAIQVDWHENVGEAEPIRASKQTTKLMKVVEINTYIRLNSCLPDYSS